MMETWAKHRWLRLCKRLGINEQKAVSAFKRIVNHYEQSFRQYHTFYHHIVPGLEIISEYASTNKNDLDLDLVEFSWFLHDVVCLPDAKDNEEKSALYAYVLAQELGLKEDFALQVKHLILLTKHQSKDHLLPEGQFLVELDLSFLGCDEKRFLQNYEYLREESAFFLKNNHFEEKSKRFLSRFCNRNHLFSLPFFQERFEHKAKSNIHMALSD